MSPPSTRNIGQKIVSRLAASTALTAAAATALPGGYRMLAVLILTFLLQEDAANQFSELYLWLGFSSAISGIPLASVYFSKDYRPSQIQKTVITILASISIAGVVIAWIGDLNTQEAAALFAAIVLINFFETIRTKLMVDGHFLRITLAMVFASFVFGLLTMVMSDSASLALIVFCAPMTLSIFGASINRSHRQATAEILWLTLLKKYGSYLISSGLSTALMFVLPLLLISEFGASAASTIARVFVISSAMFLVPRVLVARMVPLLRSDGITKVNYTAIATITLVFSLFTTGIFVLVSAILFPTYLPLSLLYLAMQLSQVSLPYSQVLMVYDKAETILLINFKSAMVFLLFVLSCFAVLSSGQMRGVLIIFAYTISLIYRAVANSRAVHKIDRVNI